jgi:hypothetical protein
MRFVALAILSTLAACGGQPALANAPHPDPGTVAGIAAAAAAAATLADPNAASRKPEKRVDDNKREVEVKENVPSAVFDRLDQAPAQPAATEETPKTTTPPPKRKGPAPKIPSPTDAARREIDREQ